MHYTYFDLNIKIDERFSPKSFRSIFSCLRRRRTFAKFHFSMCFPFIHTSFRHKLVFMKWTRSRTREKKNGWSPNENKHGEHSHARSDVNNSGCEMNRKAIHSIFIYIIYLSSFFIAPILAEGAGKHRSKTQSWIWIRAKRNKIRKTSNKIRPIMYLYGVLLGGVNKKRCRGFGGHLPVIIKCISNKSRTHSMNRWSDTAFRTHLPTRTILASSCRC